LWWQCSSRWWHTLVFA